MAEKTRSALVTDLTTYFPDNISGLISPSQLRAYITNLLDSVLTSLDDKPLISLYGKGVFSGQLYNDSGWALLTGSEDAAINTSAIVTSDAEKIAIGVSGSFSKWIFAGAWLETENGSTELRVDKQSGGILHIYPYMGGPKLEFAHLTYNSGWGLVAGAQSTMSILSSSDNQITLSHSNCGYNPPTITARTGAREVSAATSLSTTQTVVNLADSSGGAYTPSLGDALSVARFSDVVGGERRVDPSLLAVSDARINFLGIFE